MNICIYCNYKTERRYNLNKHLNTLKHHKNKKRYLLEQKNKESCKNSKESCKNSKESCKNGKKYNCLICNYITNNKTNYKNHLNSITHIMLDNINKKYEKQLNFFKEKTSLRLQEKQKELDNYKIKTQKEFDDYKNKTRKQLKNYKDKLKYKDTKIVLLETKVELLSEMKDICKNKTGNFLG